MPLLCKDQPKIKDLSLTEVQIGNLVKNFKFCLVQQGIMLKIEDLQPQFVKEITKTVESMYAQMGLDVVMNCIFIV